MTWVQSQDEEIKYLVEELAKARSACAWMAEQHTRMHGEVARHRHALDEAMRTGKQYIPEGNAWCARIKALSEGRKP